MIRINLLPPELRKGQRTTDYHLIGGWAAVAAATVMIVFWLYVHMVSLPGAKAGLNRLEQTLAQATKEAEAVKADEQRLAEIIKYRTDLYLTINRRMNWAKTLDDMASLLARYDNNAFKSSDYDASISEISVAPRASVQPANRQQRGKDDVEIVESSMKVRFKLVGTEYDKVGFYIRDFFTGIEESKWWKEHGFYGDSRTSRKPEDSYHGETPRMADRIKRVIIELPVEFIRSQVVPTGGGR